MYTLSHVYIGYSSNLKSKGSVAWALRSMCQSSHLLPLGCINECGWLFFLCRSSLSPVGESKCDWMNTAHFPFKSNSLQRVLFTVTKSYKLWKKTAVISSIRSTSIDCFDTNKQLLQLSLNAFTDICLQTTVSPPTPAGCYYICPANMVQAASVRVKTSTLPFL